MEEHKFDKLDQLIRSKQFEELDPTELSFVLETLGNEAAYRHYQQLIKQSSEQAVRPVSARVSRDLTQRFKEKNRSAIYSWMTYRVPAYVNLMLILLFFAGIWFWPEKPAEIVQITKEVYLPGKTDTLLVQLPPDTVVIERVIQKNVPVYITSNAVEIPKTPDTEGSSLAEQQDLTDFLVSGRD